MDFSVFSLFGDMFTKHPNQCWGFVVRRASAEYFAGAVFHDRDQIGGSVTMVTPVDLAGTIVINQIRRVAGEGLQAWAFIE